MRALVCGDRKWTNRARLDWVLGIMNVTSVIEGEAKGADTMAREWADTHNTPVYPFYADWTKYGKAAGPTRNREMLYIGKPDRVIAFHNNISESKGTANMIEQARRAKVPVILVTDDRMVWLKG